MNPIVSQYIDVFDNGSFPANEEIIDRSTRDLAPSLTGGDRERALFEVDVMRWTDNYPDHQSHISLVRGIQQLHARIAELAARVSALEAAGQ